MSRYSDNFQNNRLKPLLIIGGIIVLIALIIEGLKSLFGTMTLYQFNMMDEMEQIEAIWYQSTKLAEREDDTFLYILYQIHSFYIEEKIHKEHNVRHAFKSFSSTNSDLLKPYLDKIDIPKFNGEKSTSCN